MTLSLQESLAQITTNNDLLLDYLKQSLQIVDKSPYFDVGQCSIAKEFAMGVERFVIKIVEARGSIRECCQLVFEIMRYKPANWDSEPKRKRVWTAIVDGCMAIIECAVTVMEQGHNYFKNIKQMQIGLQYFYEMDTGRELVKSKRTGKYKRKKRTKAQKKKEKNHFPLHLSMKPFSDVIMALQTISEDYERKNKILLEKTQETLRACMAAATGEEQVLPALKEIGVNEEAYQQSLKAFGELYEDKQAQVAVIVNELILKEEQYFQLQIALNYKIDYFSIKKWQDLQSKNNLLDILGANASIDAQIASLLPFVDQKYQLDITPNRHGLTADRKQEIAEMSKADVNDMFVGLENDIRAKQSELDALHESWRVEMTSAKDNVVQLEQKWKASFDKLHAVVQKYGVSQSIVGEFLHVLKRLIELSQLGLESTLSLQVHMETFFHVMEKHCLMVYSIKALFRTDSQLPKIVQALKDASFEYVRDIQVENDNEAEFNKYILPPLTAALEDPSNNVPTRLHSRLCKKVKQMSMTMIAEDIDIGKQALLPQIPVILLYLDKLYNVLQSSSVYLRLQHEKQAEQRMLAQIERKTREKQWIDDDVALLAIEYIDDDEAKDAEEDNNNNNNNSNTNVSSFDSDVKTDDNNNSDANAVEEEEEEDEEEEDAFAEGMSISNTKQLATKDIIRTSYLVESMDEQRGTVTCLERQSLSTKHTIPLNSSGTTPLMQKYAKMVILGGQLQRKDVYLFVTEKHFKNCNTVVYTVTACKEEAEEVKKSPRTKRSGKYKSNKNAAETETAN